MFYVFDLLASRGVVVAVGADFTKLHKIRKGDVVPAEPMGFYCVNKVMYRRSRCGARTSVVWKR